jgi:hypothetical protein
LRRGSGLGGSLDRAVTSAAAARRAAGAGTLAPPPRAGARAPRPNPPTSELRRRYERSDLPLVILQGARTRLQWKVADVTALDYRHYLPVFFSGLREVEEPFRFIAEEGARDLLRAGGLALVLPVLPQLVLPLRDALNTRDERVMVRALRMLAALAELGDAAGAALVPFYRMLLPVCAVFVHATKSLGDGIDYHQRFGHIGEIVQQTLATLERRGGADAFINIKYIIPTYERVA